ncbi:MAG TPA: SRPBCC family protein [Chitinophagaceae bacterium]|nr:SRPBCC family protein [Chitinophagaceae bacterium]
MSQTYLNAHADISINASVSAVWATLIDPESNNKFMFGSKVVSDWKEGSPITWTGEWKGHPYQDKGKILKMVPAKTLQYTHYSEMMDSDDSPENYRTVTIELSEDQGKTLVSLDQDKNKNEADRDQAQKNWQIMLSALKELAELR